MNREQESLLENLNRVYRLKEQAESLRKESDMLLSGMSAILSADDSHDLYKKMFEVFRSIIPYETCFVLDPLEPGFMVCSASTDDVIFDTKWPVDALLKKALSHRPIAIFNAKTQPAWTQQSFEEEQIPASVLYCPFRVNKYKSIMVFCATEIGFYTQHHVSIAERYRKFTEQTFLSVQAKLSALESEELREAKERAEHSMLHSEKMASLGLLAAGVAHEINNPIAFIKSNIEFLSNKVGMVEQLLRIVKAIAKEECLSHANQEKLESLINEQDLLFFADDMREICDSTEDGLRRVTDIIGSLKTFTYTDENNKNQSINVNECIENSLRLVSSEFKNNIVIEKHLSPSLPKISGNTGKFNQIVVNLFINASQAMINGGTLTVTSSLDSNFSENSNAGLLVTIEDTGCGIREADLGQIFQPFYTTKAIGEGTGLGLYITFSLLESLGGEIKVESELNVGTKFNLFFASDRFF